MHGETIVTGSYGGTKLIKHLTCESYTTSYPLFNYDGSDSKSIRINASFEDDRLSSISLIYKLGYSNTEEIDKSEATNHAALNMSYQNDGLASDSYSAKYSKFKDGIQLSLYVTSDDIDNKALKYFILDGLTSVAYNREEIERIYIGKGLKCEMQN